MPSSPNDQASLRAAVLEIEAHAADDAWEGPPRLFALVRVADAMAFTPALARELPAEVLSAADADPRYLVAVEQDGLPEADTLTDLLARIAWPESVDGAALVTYAQAKEGTGETLRMVVGALRSGETWCALRSQTHDSDEMVASGANLVPDVAGALAATFED